MSFTGEYRHTIDAKGRLIVPSRMRDELQEGVVLVKWFDGCIAMFSESEWGHIEEGLMAQGNTSPKARNVARRVASSAHRDEVDKQGRVNVPDRLREHAGIARDCMVVGVVKRAEIWNPERWNEQQSQGELEDLAEELDF